MDMRALAVCGDIMMGSGTLTVGDMFPMNGARTDLVVNGNVDIDTLNLPNGNGIYGGTSLVNNLNAPLGWNAGDPSSVIDCEKTAEFMKSRAGNLGLFAPNGMCKLTGTTLKLTGMSELQNVFLVQPGDFAAATTIDICVPVGSTVLVNICGTTVACNPAGVTWTTNGLPTSKLVVNFSEATSVTLKSTDVPGTLHATCADLMLDDVKIEGQLFSCNVATTGSAPIEIESVQFDGCINWHTAAVLGNGAVD